MIDALRRNWSHYLMEGLGLGLFMISAACFTTLFEHPASPVRAAVPEPTLRRVLMGLAMGATAVGLIYSPWGKRSGAHMNPSVTLAFWRLGKIPSADAIFYAIFHFIGGYLGVAVSALILGPLIADPSVAYAVTVPGMGGAAMAWWAELMISFLLMGVVLIVSNNPAWSSWTGVCAGALVALYVSVEAPLSGMS